MIKQSETNETSPEERNKASIEMFKKENLDYLKLVGEIVRDIQLEEAKEEENGAKEEEKEAKS